MRLDDAISASSASSSTSPFWPVSNETPRSKSGLLGAGGHALQELVLAREGLVDDAVHDRARRVAQLEALELERVDDLLQLGPHRVFGDEDELEDARRLVLRVGVRDGLQLDEPLAELLVEGLDDGLGELGLGLAVLDGREPEGVGRRGLLEDLVAVDVGTPASARQSGSRGSVRAFSASTTCCGLDEPAAQQRLHDAVLDVGEGLLLHRRRRRAGGGRGRPGARGRS